MGAAYEAVIWQGLWVPGWQLALHWANQFKHKATQRLSLLARASRLQPKANLELVQLPSVSSHFNVLQAKKVKANQTLALERSEVHVAKSCLTSSDSRSF